MNRGDLVRAIANKDDLPATTVDRVLDSMLEVVRLSLAVGEDVSIRGFGRFERKKMAPTQRRAPKTGQMVSVPGRTSVRFVPAQTFRRYVNERVTRNGSS